MKPETIKIDDQEYIRKDSVPATSGKIRIVILQRGWVVVGYFSQEKEACVLTHANVIRIWGTTKGLGQLAFEGPLKATVLDPSPTIRFHELTVIASLDCVEEKWSGKI